MKKKYLIIISLIILVVIALFIITKNNNNIFSEILKSDNYIISMEKCNEQKIILPNETVKELSNMWKTVSDNGPWTGELTNNCYDKVTITYTKNNIKYTREMYIQSNDTMIVKLDNMNEYYVNTTEINKYLYSKYNENK